MASVSVCTIAPRSPERVEQLSNRRALGYERVCSRGEGVSAKFLRQAVGHDTDPRPARLDERRSSDAVQTWHSDIDDHDVRLHPLNCRDGLLTIGRLANQLELSMCREHSAQRPPRAGSIIGDEEPTAAEVGAICRRHAFECRCLLPVTTSDKWRIRGTMTFDICWRAIQRIARVDSASRPMPARLQ